MGLKEKKLPKRRRQQAGGTACGGVNADETHF